MTFANKSHFTVNRLILAGLLATAGAGTIAQTTTTPQGDSGTTFASPQISPRGDRMGRHDPAKMEAYLAKRQADMKAKLKIMPAQEGAWTAFTTAMQPPSDGGARPSTEQHAELDKLTTPQRIDKLREIRSQRMTAMTALMDKRGEAAKAFYAALSPEQQKVFDAEHQMRGGRHGHGGGGHHGGMSGMEHGRG